MAASNRSNGSVARSAARRASSPACSLRCALACALACALGAGPAGGATPPAIERSFDWSADDVNADFRSDTLELSGNVRGIQGPMSIEADRARGKDLGAGNSQWTFQNSVHIRSAEADLQSSSATADFVKGQLSQVRIEGAPALFEQRNAEADRQIRGRADVIEYDFGRGIVTLTNQVWFSNGKDEFRGDVVIYNVRDERLQINPGSASGRVRGTIRPRSSSTTTAPPPAGEPPNSSSGSTSSGGASSSSSESGA